MTREIGEGSYAEWDEARRQGFLLRELGSRRPLMPHDIALGDDAREDLATFRVIPVIHKLSY